MGFKTLSSKKSCPILKSQATPESKPLLMIKSMISLRSQIPSDREPLISKSSTTSLKSQATSKSATIHKSLLAIKSSLKSTALNSSCIIRATRREPATDIHLLSDGSTAQLVVPGIVLYILDGPGQPSPDMSIRDLSGSSLICVRGIHWDQKTQHSRPYRAAIQVIPGGDLGKHIMRLGRALIFQTGGDGRINLPPTAFYSLSATEEDGHAIWEMCTRIWPGIQQYPRIYGSGTVENVSLMGVWEARFSSDYDECYPLSWRCDNAGFLEAPLAESRLGSKVWCKHNLHNGEMFSSY